MSSKRTLLAKLHAIFIAATICVLLSSLLGSNAFLGAGVALRDTQLQAVNCSHFIVATRLSHGVPKPGGGPLGGSECPNCCLSAHIGAALLPGRLSAPLQLKRIPRPHTIYYPLSPDHREVAVLDTVNGARAPPIPYSFS